MLNKLNIVNWNIFKIIIFDRDKIFFFNFWKKIFRLLNVFLLYFIVYYSQIDEQFKRINQIMKIVLRFVIALLNDFIDYLNILFKLQRIFNNNVFNNDHIFNEIVYDFIFVQFNFVFHYDIIDVSVLIIYEIRSRRSKSFTSNRKMNLNLAWIERKLNLKQLTIKTSRRLKNRKII